MKKLLIALLSVIMAVVCAFGVTACGGDNANKDTGVENEAGTDETENETGTDETDKDGEDGEDSDDGQGPEEGSGSGDEKDPEPLAGEEVTAEEWSAAVLATALASNCEVVMTDYQHYVMTDGEEIRDNSERALFDMENNLAYWYKSEKTTISDGDNENTESRTIESYNILTGGNREEYLCYDDDGWVHSNMQNFYDEDTEEGLIYRKFGLGHGYDAIEQLKYMFRDEYFNDGTKYFKDMYEDFTYNSEDGTYSYTDEASGGYVYTVAFKGGYIVNINVKAHMINGGDFADMEMNFDFINYGETSFTIPPEVIEGATEESSKEDKPEDKN